MFRTDTTGHLVAGYKASIYERADEPANKLIATVYGWSEPITVQRAEAVLKALQELEK